MPLSLLLIAPKPNFFLDNNPSAFASSHTLVISHQSLLSSRLSSPRDARGSSSSWWPFRGLSPVPPILGSTGIPLKLPLPAPKMLRPSLPPLAEPLRRPHELFPNNSLRKTLLKKKKCTITFWVAQNQIGQDTSGVRGDHKKKSAA